MAVRRSSVAVAALLGALLVVVQTYSVGRTLDSTFVSGVRFEDVVAVALLYAAAALQLHASLAAPAEQQAAAALWIAGGIAAGAVAAGAVGLGAFREFDEPDLWWATALQLAAAFAASAVVGLRRRSRRGAAPLPPRPRPGLQIVALWVLAVGVEAALGWVAWAAYDEPHLEEKVFIQLGAPLLVVLGFYLLSGVPGRLGPWTRIAATGVVAGIGVTAFAVVEVQPREIPWQLEVVGQEARFLVVRAADDKGCGAKVAGEVVERTADALSIRVTRTYGRCPGGYRGLEGNPGTIKVALDPPLHGERITGPRMLPITASRQVRRELAPRTRAGQRKRNFRRVMPRVTGMAPQDAAAFLGTMRRGRLGVVTWAGDGAMGRAVIAQSPAASGVFGPPLSRWSVRRPSTVPITLTTGG